ncbi:response regulator transcription factor [Candidatus Contubernalis alkaliaceticus]|uniref:response regulator transcription factor n=1 Tax=Candidatus Contubernalis alkaliaceticus TaxID=338645 RepID=UPI001F4BD3AC|nr:response regulator transcription factor [Candidatus Contubernalis alkalaceticus]UNC90880.1 response regulator transcription factor [Candidatus Contubernalis alkalaceticus]
MNKKVLIVDDEESILKLIQFNLEKSGFEVVTAEDGLRALELVKQNEPDLIILDIMLPGIDGIEVCRSLRKEDINLPVLMLTAKEDEIDKILGLEIGADDYMTKPFSVRELIARVKALLRRSFQYGDKGEERLRVNDLEVFPDRYEVMVRGESITLTPKEFELLEVLVRSKGKVLHRKYLLNKLWGYDYYGDTRIVDVHISNLREKIELDSGKPEYIKTVRGVGYKFRE